RVYDVHDINKRVVYNQHTAGVIGLVLTSDAEAELEPQVRVVPHAGGHHGQVLACHVDPQLIVLHHDLLHCGVELDAGLGQRLGQDVHDLVEVSAVGAGADRK